MNKKNLIIVIFLLMISMLSAQDLSNGVQAMYDACLSLRTAIGSGNTTGLKAANKNLKDCSIQPFSSLRNQDSIPLSVDGHFVFDVDFIDSLIAGRDVYKFAERYASPRGVRGSSSSGKVFAKTCAVRKQSSAKFSFSSRGLQELVVITEPGGLISLRIHDQTHNKWYNDTEDFYDGKPYRIFVFNLPDEKSLLEIEVFNFGEKDCSFVIISN